MKCFIQVMLWALALLALGACGGSGGSSNAGSIQPGEPSRPSDDDLTDPAYLKDLEDAKAMVANTRGLILAFSSLDKSSDSYDEENILAGLQNTARQLTEPVAAMGDMLTQLSFILIFTAAENIDDEDFKPISLADAAEDTYLDFGGEKQFGDEIDFLKRFVSGEVIRSVSEKDSEVTWGIENARLDYALGDSRCETVENALSIVLTEDAHDIIKQGVHDSGGNEESTKLPKGRYASHVSANINYANCTTETEGELKLTDAGIDVELAEQFRLNGDDTMPKVATVTFSAEQALLSVTKSGITTGFDGSFGFTAVHSEEHENLNEQSELAYLILEQTTLSGVFDNGKGSFLEASLGININNAKGFGFIEPGFSRNDLAKYYYDEDANKVIIQVLGDTGYTVKLSLKAKNNRNSPYIKHEIFSNTGELISSHDEALYIWNYEGTPDNKNIRYVLGELANSTPGHDPYYSFRLLDEHSLLSLTVPNEGTYRLVSYNKPDSFPDLSDADKTKKDLVMYLTDETINDPERFIKADLGFEIDGKELSEQLTDVDLIFRIERTGYQDGKANLEATWEDKEGEERTLNLNGKLIQGDLKGVTIKDDHSIVFNIAFDQDSNKREPKGRIIKNNKILGTLKTESSHPMISWEDGDFDSLY